MYYAAVMDVEHVEMLRKLLHTLYGQHGTSNFTSFIITNTRISCSDQMVTRFDVVLQFSVVLSFAPCENVPSEFRD